MNHRSEHRIFKTVDVEKDDPLKRNVYNYHLATCSERPRMIDDDLEINDKIDHIMKTVEKKKIEEERAKKAFQCPFCGAKYKNENLRHLVQCAMNADDSGGMQGKLKSYFEKK